jgi:hypothetical protein
MPAVHSWPQSVYNRNKQPITSTASMTLNPVEVYKRAISQTCSTNVLVKKDSTNAANAEIILK